MNEWKDVSIGDLCETVSNTYRRKDQEVILVNTSDVLEGKILNHQPVANENLKGQFKKTFQKDDILYSEIRPANKRYAFVDFESTDHYIASTKLMVLRPKTENVTPRYLYAVLTSKEVIDEMQHLAETRSGTFPQITFSSELAPYHIKLPNLEIQKKIVSLLDAIEHKIETNVAINENLEQQLTALFIHDFADGIATASTDTCPMLGDLITVIDNRGKTPPLTTEIFDYPIIDVGALKGSGRIVDFNNCTKYVKQATYETWFRSGHPKSWDILISTVGSLAEMKIYLGSKGCIAQNVVALRATSISPLYLYQYLRFIRADLVAYNIGSVQPSIKVTHIVKHPIFVPEISKLQEFEEIARVITNRLYANYNECESLKKLRNTLLPKLMSGELDVSDLDL